MLIRPYKQGEELALLTVFQSAVRESAARYYTASQIDAWAPKEFTAEMREQWIARIHSNHPWVAEVEGKPVGFADLQVSGYIDQFFVAAPYAGLGIGSALMKQLHATAETSGTPRLFAHVSLAAQAFFAHHGFVVEEERTPVIRNVTLSNALMSKHLR